MLITIDETPNYSVNIHINWYNYMNIVNTPDNLIQSVISLNAAKSYAVFLDGVYVKRLFNKEVSF